MIRLEVVLPEGPRSIEFDDHAEPLTTVLADHGIALNTRCGGRDLCSGCRIVLESGVYSNQQGEHVSHGTVRACQVIARDQGRIVVPQRSLLGYQPQVVGDFKINVPVSNDPLTPGRWSAAVDIGTTTVVVQLVSPAGELGPKASGFNQQMRLGDDVLTRINLCRTDPQMLERLQRAVVEDTINPLLEEACKQAKISASDLAAVVLAGNTTMLHLVLGVDPSTMGVAPFTPQFLEYRTAEASAIGLIASNARVHALPGAAAYVGADLTAGVYATALAYEEGPSMIVDVGTNGEIVLKANGRLYGCATAAGPAFEGSGLESGMRAGAGAVSHIWLGEGEDPIAIEVIGGGVPAGICGSAYIDFLAEGRASGLLTAAGRFNAAFVERHPSRFERNEYGWHMLLGEPNGPKVSIGESDVALLLQAKAAVAAGVATLLRQEGLRAEDVLTLHLAGGFGMHVRLESALACGLLPGFLPGQVELVGNTSLGGAVLAVQDRNTVAELAEIGLGVQIVELNLDPDFEDEYVDQLQLP